MLDTNVNLENKYSTQDLEPTKDELLIVRRPNAWLPAKETTARCELCVRDSKMSQVQKCNNLGRVVTVDENYDTESEGIEDQRKMLSRK